MTPHAKHSSRRRSANFSAFPFTATILRRAASSSAMANNLQSRTRAVVLISALVAILATAVTPFLGGSGMDYARVVRQQAPDWTILIHLRIPRALLALLVGSALSAGGALFQALLRDALATPSSL